ncbi:MAG: amidohydrolase [Rhizobiales bacterium 65-9]|nr:MAG: amidohydrolase [Rhizobiales bacterium 65-9]
MIDAHQHFWRVDRGDYGWLTPALGPIHRDFDPRDLQPFLARHGIGRTILVQAAPTVAETEFMLAAAADAGMVAGVVGWVDFESDDAPGQIERLARHDLLVGLRPMVHDIPDDEWLARAPIDRAVDAMKAHGLVFDALVKPQHLAALLRFAERHRDLAIVIDHLAKPPIAARGLDPWRSGMSALAGHAHIACKLSGMVTEASADWTLDDLRPYVDHAMTIFGAERMLWGSDWPVVDLAGGYDRWREASLALLAGLDVEARANVLGRNAERIYLSKRGRRA